MNRLWEIVEGDSNAEITIDLAKRTVEIPSAGLTETFQMDAQTQERFMKGLDDIGITLAKADEITRFESTRPAWLARR